MHNLTTRGRVLLAIGLVTAGAAWGLRQPAIVAVSLLLVLVPLVGVLVVRRSRFVLGSSRIVHPARIPVGSAGEVVLVVENGSRLSSGVLLLEDLLPPSLGEPVRLTLDSVAPRAQRSQRYPVIGRERGRTRIGPLAVTVTDPFGMAALTREFSATNPVVVTPQIVPLGDVGGASHGGRGEMMSRSVAARGDNDVLPREHRAGDDMRRIHWRATARHGDLMVRREEQAWHSALVLILDTRDRAYVGAPTSAAFEWAVSAAASVAIHYLRQGWRVTAVTTGGQPLIEASGTSDDAIDSALLAFAEVRMGPEPLARNLMSGAEGAAALVLVAGHLDTHDVELLRRPATGFAGCLLLEPCPADHFRSAGWQVCPWTPDASVAAAWSRLSAAPAGSDRSHADAHLPADVR